MLLGDGTSSQATPQKVTTPSKAKKTPPKKITPKKKK
uniref:Uncharacterized protein n=1 Tax=Arundo donax TaxID=35708 RepID=A0A0A8ZX36_ARUDO